MDVCLYSAPHHQLTLLCLLESQLRGSGMSRPFSSPNQAYAHTLFVCLEHTSSVPPGEYTKKLNPKESDPGVQPGLAAA